MIEEQASESDADGPASAADGQAVLRVERRFVETGERRAGQVVILKGLQAGERVVSAGQLKLDNGARVAIVADALDAVETTE
ncbi:efflux transporter, RND family, MFP subunit [compost metagenome]